MRDPACTLCPLHQGVKTVCIPADGPASAKLLVIGEGPGADEDDVGKPFVGMSGKLLRAALDRLGVEYRITNTVRCRPPDNRKPLAEEILACRPYLEADFAEMPNLRVVVTLGDIATKAMGLKGQFMKELVGVPVDVLPPRAYDWSLGVCVETGEASSPAQPDGTAEVVPKTAGLGQTLVVDRRQPTTGPECDLLPLRRRSQHGRTLVPLAHPAYVLRNRNYLPTWESHWAVVRNLLVPTDDPAARVGVELLDHVEIP